MESQNIEYKQSWKDEYLKWICGFANAQGGTLYIGIDDNENVVGVDNAKYLLDNLPNKCIQATGIVPDFENLTQKGKAYLTIHIKASDHLGSASWITDNDGIPIQHLQYLPFGEPFVNQRLSGYNERFTFTAKERDAETGYGYFGARYMDHELMTMWLTVDPLADKYPGISPYAYCAWNPLSAVDPDGKDSVRTPNGVANVGEGYKVTPDGQYLYGEGLQTKKWNPNLEIGGIIGDGTRGGYENSPENQIDFNSLGQNDHLTLSSDAVAIAIPVAISIGDILPEIVSIAEDVISTAANYVWIIPACVLMSSDSRPNHLDVQGGHNANARKSTKGKHESGDRRRLQDQCGAKGEKIQKGKRPQGYKGPWPPKKKNR